MRLHSIVGSTVAGGLSGFLTRPCCVIPALLSLSGVGSAGLGGFFIKGRPLFLVASAGMLGTSMLMNLRREGGWVNKSLAVGASLLAFALSANWIGVW
ncbi:MAG: hypothetical protein HYZ58_03205 [Acidobacteria bacterium]|nr:hypothetical protein [Acidobacteriota bacterium]